ncbi:hypothetical protein DWU98_16850 [Dyella monticola]|uniref:Type IV secretion protein Rhs n=2 Tax=Dyella monticola TaxID=1927958 RepID=A0A370WUB6_9GAMM|nr:hypothetical protein DWU98_16850 [Dyella monticola]
MGTDEPWTISRVELTPAGAARGWACCGARDHDIERERVVIQASGNSIGLTNDRDVGSSVKTVYVSEGGKRSLTRGEVEEAQTVFGSGINYATAKVHHGGWWLFMGKQDPNTAVTPNGEMYFPDAIYKNDYSSSTISPKWIALFMHEMVHVWQYQMGYAVKRHGLTVTSKGESAYIISADAG